MNAVTCSRWIFLACLLATSAALAQPAAFAQRYPPALASADGIGKRYMAREIAAVMGWQGAAWLEREEREREERTDLLLAALALRLEMAFGKSAESWLAHQAAFDLWQLQARARKLGVRRMKVAA
jgi:plasmid maintenance system antidote protein VapI